ncbi:MAG: radical SAM protein, partial [Anaerolineales bacterium]|nr:radical SAM protein [Candidatus Desulfolinea nitratireducens]
MTSGPLYELGELPAAYKVLINTEKLFPKTFYGQVAADYSKLLFVEKGGKFSPIPSCTPSVQIEPTNCCNIDCCMCGRNKNRKLGYMSLAIFEKIVDQAVSAGVGSIRLYHMGEPLMNKSIIGFVRYFSQKIKEFNFSPPCRPRCIGIQTNGMLLNREITDQFMSSGLNTLAFSIDGRNSDEYEKIRKGASFSRVINNLQEARAIRDQKGSHCEIAVCILDMGLCLEDRKRLHQFYIENGADSVSFNPCAPAEGRHVMNHRGEIIPVSESKAADDRSRTEPPDQDSQKSFGRHQLDRIVERSRFAAEINFKSVYNSRHCPIPGTIKLKGSIP